MRRISSLAVVLLLCVASVAWAVDHGSITFDQGEPSWTTPSHNLYASGSYTVDGAGTYQVLTIELIVDDSEDGHNLAIDTATWAGGANGGVWNAGIPYSNFTPGDIITVYAKIYVQQQAGGMVYHYYAGTVEMTVP